MTVAKRKRRRLRAAVVLLGLGAAVVGTVAVTPLVREQLFLSQLDSESRDTRIHAAGKLAEMGSRRAIPRLVELLEEEPFSWAEAEAEGWGELEIRVLSFAAEALIELGRPAVPALIEKLDDDNPELREAVLLIFAEMGPEAEEAVLPVVRRLGDQEEPEEEVRRTAARALGSIGPAAAPAVPALSEAMNNDAERVRWAAAAALAELGPRVEGTVAALVAALKHEDAKQRWIGGYGLRNMGPGAAGAIPDLVQALADRSENVRYYAAITLGRIGPPARSALEELRGSLQDESENVRIAASEALEKIQGKLAAGGAQGP
jgi:HEAT repeat protein